MPSFPAALYAPHTHTMGGALLATQWGTHTLTAVRLATRLFLIVACNVALAVVVYPDDGTCEGTQFQHDCDEQPWPSVSVPLDLASSLSAYTPLTPTRICAWNEDLHR